VIVEQLFLLSREHVIGFMTIGALGQPAGKAFDGMMAAKAQTLG